MILFYLIFSKLFGQRLLLCNNWHNLETDFLKSRKVSEYVSVPAPEGKCSVPSEVILSHHHCDHRWQVLNPCPMPLKESQTRRTLLKALKVSNNWGYKNKAVGKNQEHRSMRPCRNSQSPESALLRSYCAADTVASTTGKETWSVSKKTQFFINLICLCMIFFILEIPFPLEKCF